MMRLALPLVMLWWLPGMAAAQNPDGTPMTSRVAAQPPAMSLAVIDFRNASRDTNDALLSEGLAEELTVRLGQVSRLTVASRTAVRRLRGADTLAVPDIGRSLRVAYLVTGSLRRSGQRVRVSVELLRTSNGAQLWSSQYDRSDQDLLAIQEAIAIEVASGVAGRLLPAERAALAGRPTRVREAYDAYLLGRAQFVRGWSNERAIETIRLFQRAVDLDPRYADAWAMLARAHVRQIMASVDRSAERVALVRGAVERAVSLEPGSAVVQTALGNYYFYGEKDYEAALRAYSAALALNPRDTEVQNAIANVARRQGRWDLSQESRAQTIREDPGSGLAYANRADTWILLRRFTDARSDVQHALALYGDSIYPAASLVELALATGETPDPRAVALLRRRSSDLIQVANIGMGLWRALPALYDALDGVPAPATAEARLHYYAAKAELLVLRRSPEAAATLDSARAIGEALARRSPDDDVIHAQLARTYTLLRRCDDALRSAQRAVELLPVSRDTYLGPDRLLIQAQTNAQCQQPDRALDLVEQLLAMPSRLTVGWLRVDPIWAPLRGHPRFERLIAAN